MKKLLYLGMICFSFMSFVVTSFSSINAESVVYAERPTPPYAKWGNIAVQKTKERYPNAEVVDYLHVGRENKGNHSVEKFKLWLKGKNREFGVLVNIEFNNSTEQIVKITYKEVAR
ncbi:YqzG/YhdC family protein [Niallia sp. XMNu-256]|uniref:YqzG/YhdC family protein n=1 Tax=Niallia sp. XMNu-256 TaxID=3082444 RepID=UPI0030CFF0C4